MDFTCSICLDDISRNVCHNCLRRVCEICVVIDNQMIYCSTKCYHDSILNDNMIKNWYSDENRHNLGNNMPLFGYMGQYKKLLNYSNHSKQNIKKNNFALLWLQTYLIKDIAKIVISY